MDVPQQVNESYIYAKSVALSLISERIDQSLTIHEY
jgi:hypothetical protein